MPSHATSLDSQESDAADFPTSTHMVSLNAADPAPKPQAVHSYSLKTPLTRPARAFLAQIPTPLAKAVPAEISRRLAKAVPAKISSHLTKMNHAKTSSAAIPAEIPSRLAKMNPAKMSSCPGMSAETSACPMLAPTCATSLVWLRHPLLRPSHRGVPYSYVSPALLLEQRERG